MSDLWTETEQKVKDLLSAMPDPHRAKFKDIATTEFPDLIKALQTLKTQFQSETHIGEQNRLAARYVRIYGLLARLTSLMLLGVPRKAVQGQIDLFFGRKELDQTSAKYWPAMEVGLFEETQIQSFASTS
jgi:hypothetical protein